MTIARAAKGEKRSFSLAGLAAKVVNQDYEVKSTRIVDFESVKNVEPAQRYITAVNIIKQSELTPDEPDPIDKEGRASGRKDKGKASANGRAKRTSQTPEASRKTHQRATSAGTVDNLTGSPIRGHGASSPILGSSPVVNPYSPRQPSRLSHSISASNLSDLERTSPSPPTSARDLGEFSPPQRALSFGNRITSPLMGSHSPARSPKMSILARPPLSRRHTSGPANFDNSTGSPFDSVDLQVSTNILTTRLTRLVERGVLIRTQYQQRPIRHEYHLTERGLELYPVALAIITWGERWKSSQGPLVPLTHVPCRSPLEPELCCGTCMKPLALADTEISEIDVTPKGAVRVAR
ncbi:MAG: hypothetical protein EOO77_30940 [Oxalobacteraceae bacterium]|nr:MAG: hypothetical protein EOO77_30940 [Oxalobacteraceae bacterium]